MSELKEQTLAERVRALIANEKSVTMYRAANIMSEVLQRRVREQMLYNYRANKRIRVNSLGRVEADVLVAFIVKFATPKVVDVDAS